jgi:hypothetical protein
VVTQESHGKEADFSAAPLANGASGFGRNDGALMERSWDGFGDEKKKARTTATTLWRPSAHHPTHRKVRDGWGTPAPCRRQQQIPCGDDNKKD